SHRPRAVFLAAPPLETPAGQGPPRGLTRGKSEGGKSGLYIKIKGELREEAGPWSSDPMSLPPSGYARADRLERHSHFEDRRRGGHPVAFALPGSVSLRPFPPPRAHQHGVLRVDVNRSARPGIAGADRRSPDIQLF